ncbi:glycosyltransferase family 4 protein [Rhodoferax ferrireducens]|uniref:glycosyltransferase family 4 protein n=1 Tax=Rhodoferax ferrireducens TaxID=192843 RepID=UPI000E0DD98B|nr:glycosyltransferase family 1 protein [Rhodoferax ferrireducens]
MKISIDATGLGGVKTGTAVYLTEILQVWNQSPDIDHNFFIFASPKTSGYLNTLGLDSRFSFIDAPDSRLMRVFWQQLLMPWHLWRLGINVHWGCGFVLPLLSRRRMVVTIYDLTFQLFPAVHERVKRYYFPLMISAAVRKAKRVIAISETTRNDLHQLLPASVGKTEVTLLAPRTLPSTDAGLDSIFDTLAGGRGYVICLGTLEPRKNLRRLFDAWLDIDKDDRLGIKLVVVGVRGWMMGQVTSRNQEADDSVVFTGFLEDADLSLLLGGALALAYPSLYEGFGLPVLEAMSQGVPVLTSNTGATQEISGGAALLVDATDVLAIKDALLRLLKDGELRERLSVLGIAHAARYSWTQTARQTLAVLEQAATL